MVPFFSSLVITPTCSSISHPREFFARLGRFSEKIWTIGKVYKTYEVKNIDANTVTLAYTGLRKQTCFRSLSKIIALVAFFPFLFGFRCVYKCCNKFKVKLLSDLSKQSNSIDLPIIYSEISNVPTKKPINLSVLASKVQDVVRDEFKKDHQERVLEEKGSEKIEDGMDVVQEQILPKEELITEFLDSRIVPKFSYKKLDPDTLFKRGQENLLAKDYEEALECLGRFLICLDNKFDDRKVEALKLAFECLKNLKKVNRRLSAKDQTYTKFRELFTEYKEHRIENNDKKVLAKLALFGEVSPYTLSNSRGIKTSDLPIEEVVKNISVKNEKTPEGFKYKYALSYSSGKANVAITDPQMEDRHGVTSILIKQKDQVAVEATVFIIADGHGDKQGQNGTVCSQFVIDQLPKMLEEELNAKNSLCDKDVFNSMKLAPVKVQDLWKKGTVFSATTFCFALIFKDQAQTLQVWLGNAGDCRAVITTNLEYKQVTTDGRYRDESKDINPADKQFLTSIALREGVVKQDHSGVYRLDGLIQPFRGIGHQDIKGFSSRPDVTKVDFSKLRGLTDVKLFMFTDGVGDVVEAHEVKALTDSLSLEMGANRLVAESILRDSNDNITVLGIELEPQI